MLLLDQNLSWRLARSLQDIFPDSIHLQAVGLDQSSDDDVWLYAKEHGYTLVSKDSDFEQRSLLRGHPPKCIWLRLGNASTEHIENVIRSHVETIQGFLQSNDESLLLIP